jgi:hypothetical protein
MPADSNIMSIWRTGSADDPTPAAKIDISLDSSLVTRHLSLRFSGAVSSVVEHYLDTVGVRGSKPLPRTMSLPREAAIYANRLEWVSRHCSRGRRYFARASASVSWRRPNHRLNPHQNATSGTAR